jgi:hypothetical protein
MKKIAIIIALGLTSCGIPKKPWVVTQKYVGTGDTCGLSLPFGTALYVYKTKRGKQVEFIDLYDRYEIGDTLR